MALVAGGKLGRASERRMRGRLRGVAGQPDGAREISGLDGIAPEKPGSFGSGAAAVGRRRRTVSGGRHSVLGGVHPVAAGHLPSAAAAGGGLSVFRIPALGPAEAFGRAGAAHGGGSGGVRHLPFAGTGGGGHDAARDVPPAGPPRPAGAGGAVGRVVRGAGAVCGPRGVALLAGDADGRLRVAVGRGRERPAGAVRADLAAANPCGVSGAGVFLFGALVFAVCHVPPHAVALRRGPDRRALAVRRRASGRAFQRPVCALAHAGDEIPGGDAVSAAGGLHGLHERGILDSGRGCEAAGIDVDPESLSASVGGFFGWTPVGHPGGRRLQLADGGRAFRRGHGGGGRRRGGSAGSGGHRVFRLAFGRRAAAGNRPAPVAGRRGERLADVLARLSETPGRNIRGGEPAPAPAEREIRRIPGKPATVRAVLSPTGHHRNVGNVPRMRNLGSGPADLSDPDRGRRSRLGGAGGIAAAFLGADGTPGRAVDPGRQSRGKPPGNAGPVRVADRQ